MTTGITAAENTNIKIGDTVCIMGSDSISLMTVAEASRLGAARIIGIR